MQISRFLIIWKREDNSYYYKIVVGTYQHYFVGFINSYGHVIVLIIPIQFVISRPSFKKRLYKRIISYLEKKL